MGMNIFIVWGYVLIISVFRLWLLGGPGPGTSCIVGLYYFSKLEVFFVTEM